MSHWEDDEFWNGYRTPDDLPQPMQYVATPYAPGKVWAPPLLRRCTPSEGTKMPIRLGWRGLWRRVFVNGGPFDASPDDGRFFLVKVRAEASACAHHHEVPIRDFQVPGPEMLGALDAALEDAANKLFYDGIPVYVGCMGGIGRTGLFLALFAKACGVREPVTYVRKHYKKSAVETRDQQDFVRRYDVSWLTPKINAWARRRRFSL